MRKKNEDMDNDVVGHFKHLKLWKISISVGGNWFPQFWWGMKWKNMYKGFNCGYICLYDKVMKDQFKAKISFHLFGYWRVIILTMRWSFCITLTFGQLEKTQLQ